jgi:hypothetical protein
VGVCHHYVGTLNTFDTIIDLVIGVLVVNYLEISEKPTPLGVGWIALCV